MTWFLQTSLDINHIVHTMTYFCDHGNYGKNTCQCYCVVFIVNGFDYMKVLQGIQSKRVNFHTSLVYASAPCFGVDHVLEYSRYVKHVI